MTTDASNKDGDRPEEMKCGPGGMPERLFAELPVAKGGEARKWLVSAMAEGANRACVMTHVEVVLAEDYEAVVAQCSNLKEECDELHQECHELAQWLEQARSERDELVGELGRAAEEIRDLVELTQGHGKVEVRLTMERTRAIAERDELAGELAKARGLLTSIYNEASVHRQPEGDTTRGWCSEMQVYLRGNVGLSLLLAKEEFSELERMAGLPSAPGAGGL